MNNHQEALDVHASAELLIDHKTVQHAYDELAKSITRDLEDKNPLVMAVMNGGLVPMGQLLPRMHFSLRIDYLHATRYRDKTTGHDLQWKQYPQRSLENEHVLVIDDIFDEGHTLAAIVAYCEGCSPASIRTAVLAEKDVDRSVTLKPDYVGLQLPNKYVYGCGLDYKGYWRNLPAIYAVKEN